MSISFNNNFIPKKRILEISPPECNVTSSSSKKTKKSCTIKKTPKYGREILAISVSPSLSQEEKLKNEGKFCEESIKYHAFMRVQLFAIKVAAYYNLAKDRNISIDLHPAYLQVNKGSKKYPAAHSIVDSGSGDNFRKTFIEEIVEKHNITPTKKKFLEAKGFTEKEFERMLNNNQAEVIQEIFDHNWPVDSDIPSSIFYGTRTDVNLNSTTEAPLRLNLGIDKRLEFELRPKMSEIYQLIMRGEISREDACEKFCKLILDFFWKLDIKLNMTSINISEYIDELLKLDEYRELCIDEIEIYKDKITTILENLKQIANKLCPSKHPSKKIKASPQKNESDHLNLTETGQTTIVNIAKNKKFLKASLSELKKKDSLETFTLWMQKLFDTLKQEITDQKNNVLDLIKFCRLEEEGTQLPDFKILFGEYDPITEKRKLTEEIYEKSQERLWKPITPEKANPESERKKSKKVRKKLDF